MTSEGFSEGALSCPGVSGSSVHPVVVRGVGVRSSSASSFLPLPARSLKQIEKLRFRGSEVTPRFGRGCLGASLFVSGLRRCLPGSVLSEERPFRAVPMAFVVCGGVPEVQLERAFQASHRFGRHDPR